MSLLKNRVSGKVKFLFYQAGQLWYECEDSYRFSVDVPGDTGTGRFLVEDKGLYFMRYIKRGMLSDEKGISL